MRSGRLFAGLLSVLLAMTLPLQVEAASKSSKKVAAASATKHAKPVMSVKVVKASSKPSKSGGKRKKIVAAVESADFDSAGIPLIRSSAFYVQDVSTGQVLLQKNASAALPIASITKLMTSMVVLDAHQNLGEVLEITDADVDRLKSSSSHLTVGTRLTREELLHLALMASENRAASALARNYPGGMPAFLDAMNVKARLMGLSETHFQDGTGLTKNNVSSARDLAIMVANASRYPLIREFSTSTEYTATLAGGRSYAFHTTNALVKNPDWQIDVQKTGYINESGKCLVMQAWMGNKPLAIVLLDSWGRFTRLGDAKRIKKWLEASLGRQQVALHSDTRPAL
ncbi:MAG: D-alanyl-D-alanine endopeptidase [Proteobacteria bacterium]|nr:D-alanyl-D-alanine endopeptidase [Pseudomonadota bacterium]